MRFGFFYNTSLVPIPLHNETIGEALQSSRDVLYGMSLAGNTYDAYPLMTASDGYVFGKDFGRRLGQNQCWN